MKSAPIAFAALAVGLVALLLSASFPDRGETAPEGMSAPASTASEEVLRTSDTVETRDGGVIERFSAPDFSLPSLSGEPVVLAEYRDRKPVVLAFWASWCPNCRRNMPGLDTLYERYRNQVEIIGIDLEEEESTARSFADRYDIGFPIALDEDGSVGEEYGIQFTNTHVLIGKDGNVDDLVLGDLSEEMLREWLGI